MRMPYFLCALRPGDITGILFGAAILALVIYLSVGFPILWAKYMIQSRFGPGWKCEYVASGEPVCIKDVPKP